MWNSRVLAACLTIMAGSASAQECPPFFLLCPRPAEPRLEPRPQPGPPVVAPRDMAPSYGPSYGPRDIAPSYGPGVSPQYRGMYGPVAGEPFPIPAVPLSEVDPTYLRRPVSYPSNEPPGTIIIDPQNRFLYLVQGGGRAIRYGVGVGRQGFSWSGVATIRDKQAWPDWYPPKEMIQRQPELRKHMSRLQSGLGVAGGPGNPLGARAMYLWQGNKDTLYRIHGTNEPATIGQNVSSGCIRMLNQDVIDLYQRTPLGAKVLVLRSRVS
ncbi:MAG: L,D-transpeptidase family protein [Rhizobiales bacterium]|nr:L,D-transpeptidase family protein [Hyphomicrobiales bacterium]